MKPQSLTILGTVIGASLALALPIKVAAQTGTATTEIELSPQGLEILCQRFPLNSRCPGGTPVTPGTVAPEPSVGAPESDTAPSETVAPEPSVGAPESEMAPSEQESLETTPDTSTPPGDFSQPQITEPVPTTPPGSPNQPGIDSPGAAPGSPALPQ